MPARYPVVPCSSPRRCTDAAPQCLVRPNTHDVLQSQSVPPGHGHRGDPRWNLTWIKALSAPRE